MTSAAPDVSRRVPDLPRLELMATPHRLRKQLRARRDAVAAVIADEVVARTFPGREPSLEEIIRAQRIRPFSPEEHRRRQSLLSSEDWAQLRAALAEARDR
jgi:hypothetical protein